MVTQSLPILPPAPALTHQDPWAHTFICCDQDHSASTSKTPSPRLAPAHLHTAKTGTSRPCHHHHGPIGVGSRRLRTGDQNSGSSISVTPASSTPSSPTVLQAGSAPLLPPPFPSKQHGSVESAKIHPIALPPPVSHEPCPDPTCHGSPAIVECHDPHCPKDVEACSDPDCEIDGVKPCSDPGCIESTDICMDPHCEEVGDTHGGCKENEGGECCTNDSKCAESGDCQECSMEELEKWACSKEGTKIIQQYLECCSQTDCNLPIFSPTATGTTNFFPHVHNDGNVHHHLLSTLPSNNENIIPVPPDLDISPWLSTPNNPQVTPWQSPFDDHTANTTPFLNTNTFPTTVPSQTPQPAIVIPTHVCHWQNCHRIFDTMPDLLAHVASDHLGAAGFGTAEPVPPANIQANLSLPMSSTDMTSGNGGNTGLAVTTNLGVNSMAATFQTNHDPPTTGLPKPTTNPFSGDPNTELLSCLWDDCFPLSECTAPAPEACPNHAHMPAHPNISQPGQAQSVFDASQANQNLASATSQGTAIHGSAVGAGSAPMVPDSPFSPQTMLRHVLEEHLGVPGSIIGWGSAGDVNLDAFGLGTAQAQSLAIGHHQLHSHCHDHSHGHEIFNQGQHDHGQTHGHHHSWSYGSDLSHALCDHSHSGHAHSHSHHGHLPTPSTTHHTPSPPSSITLKTTSRLPSQSYKRKSSEHRCLWPGCTHLHPFKSTADLMAHLSEQHIGKGKDSYVCKWDGCDRVFRSRQKVLRHLQSHTGHKPYACELCGQSFGEAAPLAAHMRRHAKERPFKCEHPGCGKTFAISSSLTIHMRTHNGEKPFVCPHCNKGFVEASNLTKHIRTHTGERPFACAYPDCNKRFSRPDQLKRHMRIHEGGDGEEKVKRRKSVV